MSEFNLYLFGQGFDKVDGFGNDGSLEAAVG